MSVTTRKCTNCEQWYDARASSCYFCQQEERETNAALIRAVETTRLNSALSRQVGQTRVEQSAESTLRAAGSDPSGEAFGRVRPQVPGYEEMVQGIKDSLEDHPEVIDYYHHEPSDG